MHMLSMYDIDANHLYEELNRRNNNKKRVREKTAFQCGCMKF